MVIIDSKIIKYKNRSILQNKTDKKYNIYTLYGKDNKITNISFYKLQDMKKYINDLKED